MKRTLGIFVASIAVALGGIACGGDDEAPGDAAAASRAPGDAVAPADTVDADEASASGELHACSLLTPDEIQEQLVSSDTQGLEGGYRVTSEETSDDEHSVCRYQWSSNTMIGGSPAAQGQFSVELRSAELLEATRAEYDEEPIPGVGDEAFFISEVPYALVGDLAVSITNFQRGREPQIALLRAAADRL